MYKKLFFTGLILIPGILVLAACSALSPAPAASNEELIPVTGAQSPPATALLALPTTFEDVPYDYQETLGGNVYYLHDHIQALFDTGVTHGTSANPPLYSPATLIDRAHYAVFLLRAKFGSNYVPPAEPWLTFAAEDWSALPEYQAWAEGMAMAGLTQGCKTDPAMFCPSQPLTRLDAVTFALRVKNNIYDEAGNLTFAYEPPAATGTVYADMPDVNFYGTRWAEAAYASQLLPSCGTFGSKPMFCPNDPVDRAWAAYIIALVKGLAQP